jgi:GWxTD domain-containing protein
MKTFIILAVLLLSFETLTQVENANSFTRGEPNYYQDFLNFASDSAGVTRTDIFIQVPYDEVQFVLSGQNFVATYTVNVSVYNEDKDKLIMEKSWTEKLESNNFDQTTSRNNFNLSMRSFLLTPAKYVIRTSIDDKESSRNYVSENEFLVRDLSSPFAVSDILILAKSDTLTAGSKILPNISRNVSVSKTGIPIFMEIYSEAERTVNIEYAILDEKKKVISQNFKSQEVDTGTTRVFYTFKDTSLALGTYTMYVAVKGKDGENLSQVNKVFSSRWAGIPFNISDLDKAIQQMVYIATQDELDYIKKADTRDEKVKRYLAFWKKKDPVPESEDNEIFYEYYRRVDYANKNFSHYSEGWRTDRGMVFIILGSPNNVERHPFDYNAKPYEIWEYYNINRSFIFVDETGFGDYRLITPLYGDNYRFR